MTEFSLHASCVSCVCRACHMNASCFRVLVASMLQPRGCIALAVSACAKVPAKIRRFRRIFLGTSALAGWPSLRGGLAAWAGFPGNSLDFPWNFGPVRLAFLGVPFGLGRSAREYPSCLTVFRWDFGLASCL
jgi:hypothetical protein